MRAGWLDGEASDGGQPRLGLLGGQQAPVVQALFDLPAT